MPLCVCVHVHVHVRVCVCNTFVVVDIQVVWSGEDGDKGGKPSGLTLPVHTVSEGREKRGSQTLPPGYGSGGDFNQHSLTFLIGHLVSN